MKGLALASLLVGLALGTSVHFATFAGFTVVALALITAFSWTTASISELSYRVVLAAIALQVGYFATVAARIVLEQRRRKLDDRRRKD
ncbi:MAG TPA: hypothetical protein VKX28_32120 [Xanthobacteraceae bacterium]|nr:hypothetical protein [Xanthobacteraceae bacterium]